MKVLLFEFICGGGCYRHPELGPPEGSLLREGAAMLEALCDELSTVNELQLVLPVDQRCFDQLSPTIRCSAQRIDSAGHLDEVLQQGAGECDKVYIIAPEIDNILLDFTLDLERDRKLISPGSDVVELASDKWLTHQFFCANGIPTPNTELLSSVPRTVEMTDLVIKPRWGAGSWGVRRFQPGREFQSSLASDQNHCELLQCYLREMDLESSAVILQEFTPGIPASIAVWQGHGFDQDKPIRLEDSKRRIDSKEVTSKASKRQACFFPAMKQVLNPETWEYQHADGPLPDDLQARCRTLLNRVLESLPDFQGYLGIDLILDPEEPGADRVIEINPRLTSSFCQTRKLAATDWIENFHPHRTDM